MGFKKPASGSLCWAVPGYRLDARSAVPGVPGYPGYSPSRLLHWQIPVPGYLSRFVQKGAIPGPGGPVPVPDRAAAVPSTNARNPPPLAPLVAILPVPHYLATPNTSPKPAPTYPYTNSRKHPRIVGATANGTIAGTVSTNLKYKLLD
eukprot:746165-Rhodomonas_salina.1